MASTQQAKEVRDTLAYHGGTTVERIRHEGLRILWREWLEFDSVEDAQDFFNDEALCHC